MRTNTAGGRPPGMRPARFRGWQADLALAAAVAVVQIVPTFFAGKHQIGRGPLGWMGVALLAAGAASLTLRRRHPPTVLAFVFGTTLAYWVLDYPGGPVFLGLIVALFTAVTRGHRLVAWVSIGVGYVSFLWLPWLVGNEPPPTLGGVLGLAGWLLILIGAAEWVRARRERILEAERVREEEARRRASEERLRIARELHDVLAHNISLINVQAGVALHLMDERPEQARTALAAIKEASRDTLRELRSVLGVLRQVDEEPPRAPALGLGRLEEMVSRAAAAGLKVQTRVEGTVRPLPASVDLAAVRIVQEALTNVARHTERAGATVVVAYGERDLTVQIEDDGRGALRDGSSGAGHGIQGMRERAQALGGELEAGPRPGGGFRVLARLPLDGDT